MERRFERLIRVWPPAPCAACAARPAVVFLEEEGDPVPEFPEGVCPACGRTRYSVLVIVGVSADAV